MTAPLKIIFAGTPPFAAQALQALLKTSHHVLAVYTQPDKPSGRGLKLTASAVKEVALANNIPVYQPTTLKSEEEQAKLASFNADVMVVAAYGMILPKAVLDLPRLGCINIHPSLLPRWRGAAPIQRTLFFGDKKTGVTIMQMDEGLDTGPILLQTSFDLNQNETSVELYNVLAKQGADLLIETLSLLAENKLQPTVQDETLATYAKKITKEEADIHWHESAYIIECKIRAFNPWPMAKTIWRGEPLRIGFAKAIDEATQKIPGSIIRANEQGIDVATGDGVLRLLQLQKPGGKMLSVADFYHAQSHELTEGLLFL